MEVRKLFIELKQGFYKNQPNLSVEQKLQFALEWVFNSHHLELIIDVKNTIAIVIAVFVILHTVAIVVLIAIQDSITVVICVIWNNNMQFCY